MIISGRVKIFGLGSQPSAPLFARYLRKSRLGLGGSGSGGFGVFGLRVQGLGAWGLRSLGV